MENATDMLTHDQALSVYQELIANPAKLQDGQTVLAALMSGPGQFATISVELLINPGLDAKTRIYIGALLRTVLREAWMHETLLHSQKNVRLWRSKRANSSLGHQRPTYWRSSDQLSIFGAHWKHQHDYRWFDYRRWGRAVGRSHRRACKLVQCGRSPSKLSMLGRILSDYGRSASDNDTKSNGTYPSNEENPCAYPKYHAASLSTIHSIRCIHRI